MIDLQRLIEQLEEEKAAIDQALTALRGIAEPAVKRRPGRPPGSRNAVKPQTQSRISDEGRKRIAEAVRRQWAIKRAAAKRRAK